MEPGIRVLIVEDDPATRMMLAQILTDEGMHVMAAHDGAHGLRLAAAGKPQVVVLDIGLPVLDGSGFASRWHEREGTANVPIVAISGQRHGEAMATELGAAAFFAKPFDLEDFAKAVGRLARAVV